MSIISIKGYLVGQVSSLSYEERSDLLEVLIDAFYSLSTNSQKRMLRSWNGGLGACFDKFYEDLSLFVDIGDYDHISTIDDAVKSHKEAIKRNEEMRKKR
jgi:hypothetical protein